jgi:hypothetical protein
MRLYDNTRIKDFRRCPRYYYFRHYRHWKHNGDKAWPLAFGAAWGEAQNVIWPGLCAGNTDGLIQAAYDAFCAEWQKFDMPFPMSMQDEEEMSPRTPGTALEMIVNYVEDRKQQAREMELIAVERPFVVPLDPQDDTLFYVGRMDKVVRRRGKVLAIEHKTTTAYKKSNSGVPFRGAFLESFSPESQVDGYLFALHMDFPGKVGGVWVDAALVHKTVNDGFTFIPVERQLQHLDAWLWEPVELDKSDRSPYSKAPGAKSKGHVHGRVPKRYKQLLRFQSKLRVSRTCARPDLTRCPGATCPLPTRRMSGTPWTTYQT